MAKNIKLAEILTDGGTQMRAELRQEVVADYRDQWKAGVKFEPVDVFHDGAEYWLADGFHRFFGAKEAELEAIPATVHKGTQRDAILFAAGANAKHGLWRSNADKRRAVETLLNDEEWVSWSDAAIAEKCQVTHPFVANIRKELVTVTGSAAAKSDGKPRTGRDGKKRKAPKKQADPAAELRQARVKIAKADPRFDEQINEGAFSLTDEETLLLASFKPSDIKEKIVKIRLGQNWKPEEKKPFGGTSFEPSEWESVVQDAIKRPVPEHLLDCHQTAAAINSAASKLDAVKKAVSELANEPGAEFLPVSEIEQDLKLLKGKISHSRYWSECPKCKGKIKKNCDSCDGNGFLPFNRRGKLSQAEKDWLGV